MTNQTIFFREVSHKSAILPDFVASSLLAIPIATLQQRGIRHLIIDIDDTLTPRRGQQISAAYQQYCTQARQAGLSLTIGSNRLDDVTDIAASIGAGVVPRRWWRSKPRKSFFAAILKTTDHPPRSIAMIGDHPLNDVLGANRLGLTTILVAPLGTPPHWPQRRYLQWLGRH